MQGRDPYIYHLRCQWPLLSLASECTCLPRSLLNNWILIRFACTTEAVLEDSNLPRQSYYICESWLTCLSVCLSVCLLRFVVRELLRNRSILNNDFDTPDSPALGLCPYLYTISIRQQLFEIFVKNWTPRKSKISVLRNQMCQPVVVWSEYSSHHRHRRRHHRCHRCWHSRDEL